MSSWMWRLKQGIRKLVPLAVLGAFLYGGMTLYKQGAFRHGFKSALHAVTRHIPFFGSRFRLFQVSGPVARHSPSYSRSKRSHRSKSRRAHRSRSHSARRRHR